jgi:hypothetical protein
MKIGMCKFDELVISTLVIITMVLPFFHVRLNGGSAEKLENRTFLNAPLWLEASAPYPVQPNCAPLLQSPFR